MDFITEHIKWIFSGVGVAAVTGLIALLRHRQSNSRQVHRQGQSVRNGSSAYQAGRDIMINAGPPVQQITAQVRVHRAFFENSPVEFYFVNVVNPSAISDVVITHVWYGGSVRIDILNPDRPLPQRLQPRQPWETWIAVHEVPRDRDAFYNFRVKVSTGEEFASEHARDIPPRGFVPS